MLPETFGEIQMIGRLLRSSGEYLFRRDQATEETVKQLKLDDFRVIAFATHALVAGEFSGLSEPALVLTPPPKVTAENDGLLTASEIAQLRLDADWVLLSACNTASSHGDPGAEGLSGLAKAFFYAGSRALLVSHWSVASDATVALTTGTFENMSADGTIGRAEALRRAMASMINGEQKKHFAHPAFWAPFVIVGDGG